MWIILFTALDDFGIREATDAAGIRLPSAALQVEVVKRKVMDDALHAALRIAGLVS
jgi:hypothetical protein